MWQSRPVSGILGAVTPRSSDAVVHGDLVAHLVRSTSLTEREADRVLAEVLGYFGEPVADFVRRRHREMAGRRLTNDQIFAVLSTEIPGRLFSPPPLSARQLRRLVYG
jgi:hypothetical protein